MLRQYELHSDDRAMVCWLPVDRRVRIGARITLKDQPHTVWSVTAVYDAHPITDIMRGWNNNI